MPPKGISQDASNHDIAVDSLERLALAGRVVQFFQMENSGVEDYLLRRHHLSEWAEIVIKSRSIQSQGITVTTSGSTGQPKICEHSWGSLVDEADEFVRLFKNDYALSPKRIIALVPCHHIYGMLFTVLFPHRTDASVVRGLTAYSKVRNGGLCPGDVVVGFPELLTQLATQISTLPAGISFISSAGFCPAQTVNQLYSVGAARVVDVYGCPETAGIGYRSEPESTYQLLPRWQRDNRSEQQLIDKNNQAVHALPDKMIWNTANTFTIAGRIDKAISIRGINVFPSQVAELIRQHPDVLDANVRPMTIEEGSGLKAFVVLRYPTESTEAERRIKNWLVSNLRAAEIPEHVSFGKQLPVNSMGKPCDWTIHHPQNR